MPITRRKRVSPPEQSENSNQVSEQTEKASEAPVAEQVTEDVQPVEGQQRAQAPSDSPPPVSNGIAENAPAPYQPFISASPPVPSGTSSERKEPGERPERIVRHEYTPTIEGGRRTSRGELFRRPPQPPVPQPVNTVVAQQPAPQAPSREISLPLGNLLHLAYNPGYTGSDEARSQLLEELSNESKAGGRARCWSCGSIAIVYDRWNTRSKTFGEVGIAFCEICG
ncbi:MAG: hypothetical protein H0U76_02990, partial [Ktedonobacteraceae bacterium]|nr:hypothetical protein [Ktedonobacteraceae bacterium]